MLKKIINYSTLNKIQITKKNIRYICHECSIVLTQSLHQLLCKEKIIT